MVKAKIIIIFFLIVGFNLKAQQPNFFSRSEIGVHVGSMYYIGDLNQFKPFYQSKLAGGFMYRFTVHSRLSLRVNYTVGNVEAFDSDSKKAMNINRNLHFNSRIRELAGGIEFNYFPFQIIPKENIKVIMTALGCDLVIQEPPARLLELFDEFLVVRPPAGVDGY
jgi:hypothetical protein